MPTVIAYFFNGLLWGVVGFDREVQEIDCKLDFMVGVEGLGSCLGLWVRRLAYREQASCCWVQGPIVGTALVVALGDSCDTGMLVPVVVTETGYQQDSG